MIKCGALTSDFRKIDLVLKSLYNKNPKTEIQI
jgi:hypothetical protein